MSTIRCLYVLAKAVQGSDWSYVAFGVAKVRYINVLNNNNIWSSHGWICLTGHDQHLTGDEI